MEGRTVQSVCAVFDLEGFTAFCDQAEPELVVPKFLEEFGCWLHSTLEERAADSLTPRYLFDKFLGDGYMFLWDLESDRMTPEQQMIGLQNIVLIMADTCRSYVPDFIQGRDYDGEVPSRLRCGVARGRVVEINDAGTGRVDYVGNCINLASRLQKHENYQFSFSSKGIDTKAEAISSRFEMAKTAVRGLAKDVIVWTLP